MKSDDELLDTDLQLTEVKQEKTNEDKLRELLDKMNATLDKIEQRKKAITSKVG